MLTIDLITIDDRRTHDMDDAIKVEETSEGWLVWVGIADVGRGVPPGSELDQEAKARGRTQYYVTGNSPMLPRELADDSFSLWPHKPKEVLLASIRLSKNLEIVETKLALKTIFSERRLSYDEIPALLEADGPLTEHLQRAQRLSHALMSKRRDNGAFVFYDLTNGWVVTEEGALKQLNNRKDTVGYIIIQELMILANVAVATYAVEHDIPMLFRNHELSSAAPQREELMRQIQDAMSTPIVDLEMLQKRSQMFTSKAKYGSTLLGHYGLNVPAYTHFTSPIRRYADLVVHQQLRAHLNEDPLPYTKEALETVGVYLGELVAKQLQERRDRYKEKAERRAVRQANARLLDGLSAKDFERVVKVEVRSGHPPSEALAEAWDRRLAEATLPTLCQALVFLHEGEGWGELQAAMLKHLAEKPAEAVSILGQMRDLGWDEVRYEVTQLGEPHAPCFTCRATSGSSLDVTVVIESGGSSKLVKQRAAVALLAALRGLDVVFPVITGKALKTAPDTKAILLDAKNPVSLLLEYCNASAQKPPTYDFTMSGEGHRPVIRCVVKLEGLEAVATAGNKKEAKALAAQELVKLIRP